MPLLFGGHNLPPLVEIGLTDLPKSGGAMTPPAPPGTTGLEAVEVLRFYASLYIAQCELDRQFHFPRLPYKDLTG